MRVTLFGVSQATDEEYALAYEVGKKIGSKGYTLKNGAYGGTMEASAKGCQEEGGFVIGVGVEGHTIDASGRPNDYNDEVIVAPNKDERIVEMLDTDMIIVLPGQIGTLDEMFSAWMEAIIHNKKPLVVVGDKMVKFVEYLESSNFIRENQAKYILKANSLEELKI